MAKSSNEGYITLRKQVQELFTSKYSEYYENCYILAVREVDVLHTHAITLSLTNRIIEKIFSFLFNVLGK